MIVRYELSVRCRCPVDDADDHYAMTIEASRTIMVEHILATMAALPPMLQEDITEHLAKVLDCRVTTIGLHSGVKTTCTA